MNLSDILFWDFPDGSDSKKICLEYRRPGFDPWVGKISRSREWQPAPGFLPGEFHKATTFLFFYFSTFIPVFIKFYMKFYKDARLAFIFLIKAEWDW